MTAMRRAIAIGLAFFSAAAMAQADYPSRAVRVIVPFAPGGTTDILARLMAAEFQQALKQPFTVENKAGAGGNVGAAEAARSAPDGYTIMLGTPGTQSINQLLYAKMPYDTAKDFAPVVYVARVPNVLVVHPSLSVRTVPELIALLRARPGQLNYATPGSGSTGHLSTELFKSLTKTFIVHIPYKGSGPALQDLMAGQVQMTIDNLPSALPHIKSGRLVALAVTSAQRANVLPDVPTLGSVVPGYEASSWFVLVAPAGTPEAIVTRLNGEANRIMQRGDVKERFASLGADPVGGTAADLARHIAAETEKWRKVVQVSGAKVD